MKILVLCSDNPSPPINGTRIRNYHLWPELRALGHEVRVLSLTRDASDLTRSTPELEFFAFARPPLLQRIWKRLCYSYHQWPTSPSLKARVDELCASWRPDVVHAEELRMGVYLPENCAAKLTLTVHNVESELLLKTRPFPVALGRGLFTRLYRWNLRRLERRLFARAQRSWAYSELDRQRYQALYPGLKLAVTRNGTKSVSTGPEPLPAPTQLLFLGALNYAPNIEGLAWFLDEIYPALGPSFQLTVAGSGAIPEVRARLARERVRFLDTPLDLTPVYREAALLVVPLRSGSGTRGKILEALMHARPVLTTGLGVEGLELGSGVLRAEDTREFVEQCQRWVRMSEAERRDLGLAGQREVRAKYAWDVVARELEAEWRALLAGGL